jgi:cytosolic 5'-nucleotidase 3
MNNIIIADEKTLNKKIEQLIIAGVNSLHVVSDFDRTLTKCFVNGRKIPSLLALIREGSYLTAEYPALAFALYDKYHPLEVDDSLEVEYRNRMMKQWWEEHKDLLVRSGMNKCVIEDIIKRYPHLFRDGTLEFFDMLAQNNIPLLIFSAGNGNLIEGYLEKEDRKTANVHVFSNTFEFDEEGRAVGYKNEVIHTFNKSEHSLDDESYRELIKKRNHVLLLGDSLGDLGMVDESTANVVLKIGFLNENVEEKLALYKEKYDVVITGDGTMEWVNELIRNIQNEYKDTLRLK